MCFGRSGPPCFDARARGGLCKFEAEAPQNSFGPWCKTCQKYPSVADFVEYSASHFQSALAFQGLLLEDVEPNRATRYTTARWTAGEVMRGQLVAKE